jgi:tRNA threonylcarbamoyl adenosine modification protein (Sua5/YciO/YrdC/YwlC family)
MPKLLMTDKKEVGIRIPDHPVPVALVRLIDRPIINTSARIAGEEVLTDPRLIEKTFKRGISIIIDGGIVYSEPSTLIKIVDDEVEILREGKGLFIPILNRR